MHDISKKFRGGAHRAPHQTPSPFPSSTSLLVRASRPRFGFRSNFVLPKGYMFVFLTSVQTNLRNIFRHRLRHCGTHFFRFHFHGKIMKSCAYKLYLQCISDIYISDIYISNIYISDIYISDTIYDTSGVVFSKSAKKMQSEN